MAHTAIEGLAENAEEMRSLVSSGIIHITSPSSGVFAGMSFCFTGELQTMKRSDAEQIVKRKGGSCKTSVVKDLTYLVTNDITSGSSKNEKAAKFGIKIIDEKDFLKLAGI
jgi:DNA ligase (NAD+)